MNNLTRYDPFREMMSLRNAMDRLFENAFVGPSFEGERNWGLALDVSENDDEYIVKATIPGVKPEDLDITYNGNTLTIQGEMKAEEEKEGERYHVRERRFGSFSRSLTLPTNVKADQIKADYEDGILTLHLPKAEEAKPKKIQVQGGKSGKMIEGKMSESGTSR